MITLIKSHKSFEGQTQFWQHDSLSTQTTMKFSTFIPHQKPRACLIWLSGLTCTEENFISKAGAQKYLAAHQLMVLCPDTSPRGLQLHGEHDAYDFGSGASFYVDALTDAYKDHYRMESYLTQDLLDVLKTKFGISQNKISLMGHSMGGHGALTLGLRHPSLFQSISAFAPICNPIHAPWGIKAFRGYFGEPNPSWSEHDATELVRNGKKHPHSILIDQGTNDEFYPMQLMTKSFSDACKSTGQGVEIHLRDGYDHSYYFISTFIESHITFHAQALA